MWSLAVNSARNVFFHTFTVQELDDLGKFIPGKSAAEIATYLAANFEDELITAVKEETGPLVQKEWLVLKGGDQAAVDAQIVRALAVTADLREVGDGLAALSTPAPVAAPVAVKS